MSDEKKHYPTRKPDEYKYTDCRWHDLRHTWASWHVQAGKPLHVLQELGCWARPEMVQRYAHLSAVHLSDYALIPSTENTPVLSTIPAILLSEGCQICDPEAFYRR